jgi:hypothetical protein
MRPLIAYAPFRDFNVGDFVLMRSHDLDLVPFWMGIVESDVIKDEERIFLNGESFMVGSCEKKIKFG